MALILAVPPTMLVSSLQIVLNIRACVDVNSMGICRNQCRTGRARLRVGEQQHADLEQH